MRKFKGCIASDPIEDTESLYKHKSCKHITMVASPPIRLRILKAFHLVEGVFHLVEGLHRLRSD